LDQVPGVTSGVPTESGWRIDRRGTDVPVAASIAAEGEAPVGTVVFAIPIEPTIDLAERWLYFALRARHTGLFNLEPGLFASYVCATDNLLGPTSASRDRERRMAEAYSTAC
jgi:hypothetical protein